MLGLLAQPTLGCPTSDLRHFCPHVNGPNKRAAREEKEEEEKKRPAFFILNLRKKNRLEQNFLFFAGSAKKSINC